MDLSWNFFNQLLFYQLIGYIFKIKNFFLISKSLAPSGFVFNIIALSYRFNLGKTNLGNMVGMGCKNYIYVNFSIILFLYLIAWRIYDDNDKVFKITSIITILGIINVPIIKYSVDWWNTLTSTSFNKYFIKIINSFINVISIIDNDCGICSIFLLIFLMKYNTELIKIKNKGLDRL